VQQPKIHLQTLRPSGSPAKQSTGAGEKSR